MYDMKAFLALSAEEQQAKMYEWISSAAALPEERCQEEIRNLIVASVALDAPAAQAVSKVRTLALAKLPKELIVSIFRSRAQALKELPEVLEKDRAHFFMTIRDLPTDVQRLIMQIGSELRAQGTP